MLGSHFNRVQENRISNLNNFKLGPVGFLCLTEDKVPGNAGVKDVVLALRWVRDNIVAFKGNPASVVIAGQSFGAAMVEALTLSPMAHGLYHGVILQSGTVLAPWSFNYDAKQRAMALAKMIGDDEESTTLQNANIVDLVDKSNKLDMSYFPFGICEDRSLRNEERLLFEAPIDLLTGRKVNEVPIMMGYNTDEAYVFASALNDPKVMEKISKDISVLLPVELKFINEKEMNQVAQQIEDVYFKKDRSLPSFLAYHRARATTVFDMAKVNKSSQLLAPYMAFQERTRKLKSYNHHKQRHVLHQPHLPQRSSPRLILQSSRILLPVLLLRRRWSMSAEYKDFVCEVRVKVEGGWVCGVTRQSTSGVEYDSFRGIPYARQPLGELRFKELQPVEPWPHHLDATKEGPICTQTDEIYGLQFQPHQGMSESCIYANIHVPRKSPAEQHEADQHEAGLPILVFIHGGGFQSGSSNLDMHGPDYLISRGIIVITFNYRLNVFGFLSLNTSEIPGNNGLRDQVTFLRWLQRNAKAFGGNPEDVTLSGHSAGSTSAHLLSLSPATKGLFRRVILMSGTAFPSYYSPSPIYARLVATMFLTRLGINTTDPVAIHKQLVTIPIERIVEANRVVQYETGIVTFVPVVEAKHPGVTRIIEDDPEELVKRGRGKEYPLIIGYTTTECEVFKWRLDYIKMLDRIEKNPLLILPPNLIFSVPPTEGLELARRVRMRYFHGKPTLDEYIILCTDEIFKHAVYKLAQWRSESGAPVFLYEFSYETEFNVLAKALFLDEYKGATHGEDLSLVFRSTALLREKGALLPTDNRMKDKMITFFTNFMKCDDPTCSKDITTSPWPPVFNSHVLNYQVINNPGEYHNRGPTHEQWDMIKFFDSLESSVNTSKMESNPTMEENDIRYPH
uniref:Esterase n=1 Tax=Manduca sexta TaxID=7130 RepID=A0A977XMF0_MANSE|nr:esterase [Manduca sexta]